VALKEMIDCCRMAIELALKKVVVKIAVVVVGS
jgi:hypothetical protein